MPLYGVTQQNDCLAIAIRWTGVSPCCVCFVAFLHMNFSSTPNSILNLTISQESQSFTEFNDTFCVGKYCQLFTHESIIDQYAISALYSPPNCPFPFDDHHQNLIHPYRARPLLPPQTASRSNQPCCDCSHVRTDRWDKRKLYSISAMLIQRRANNCVLVNKKGKRVKYNVFGLATTYDWKVKCTIWSCFEFDF